MLRRILSIALPLTLLSWGLGNAQEKKLEPLIVSYSSFTGNRAPFWIAKELGLYEKYGLDVKLVSIAAGVVSETRDYTERPFSRPDLSYVSFVLNQRQPVRIVYCQPNQQFTWNLMTKAPPGSTKGVKGGAIC